MGRLKRIGDDELLSRARAVLVRDGLSVSSRALAREIGVSSSVLFQRYGSMQALLLAAMVPPAPDIAALLGRRDDDVDPAQRISGLIAALLEYMRELAPLFAALAPHPGFRLEQFLERHPDSPIETLRRGLTAELAFERARGTINCDDEGTLAFELIALAFAMAMFERLGVHEQPFGGSLIDRLAHLIWRGLAPAGGSAQAGGTANAAPAGGAHDNAHQ